jgi:hypothetical protein
MRDETGRSGERRRERVMMLEERKWEKICVNPLSAPTPILSLFEHPCVQVPVEAPVPQEEWVVLASLVTLDSPEIGVITEAQASTVCTTLLL